MSIFHFHVHAYCFFVFCFVFLIQPASAPCRRAEKVWLSLRAGTCPPPTCEWTIWAHPSTLATKPIFADAQQGARPEHRPGWGQSPQHAPSIMGNFFDRQRSAYVRVSLPAVSFVWQLAMIILFGVFIRYDEESDAHWVEYKSTHNITSDIENDFYFRYPSKCGL